MKNFLMTLAVLSAAGWAAMIQAPRTEAQPVAPFAEAERMAEQRNYEGARGAYQRLAVAEAGSPVAEEALYRSTRILLVSENPAKNHILAARELETLLQQYPRGRFARDAADWLAVLNAMQQTRVNALLEQIDEYEKRAIVSGSELRKAEAERDELKGRIDSLVRERDQLLLDASALRQEQSGLKKDRGTLAKKVEVLMKEKGKLLAAKAKLEKRLRDITEVDIKMERERKKMK